MILENIKLCLKEAHVALDKLLPDETKIFTMLFNFLIFFILITPDIVWATGTKPSLQVAASNLSSPEINKQIKLLKDSIITLQESDRQQHQTMNNRYNRFEDKINLDNDRNKLGSIFILLSLLFEIPAVIFLSGNSFIETQNDIFTLKRSPNMIASWGSGLEPLDTKIRYLSFVAIIFLFLGFALQLSGIVYILVFSLKWIFFWIIFFIILGLSVIFYLISIGSQTRSEKLKTVIRNTIRLLLMPKRIETKRCDYCLKMMKCIDTEIWWLDHASDEPYDGMIRIGHSKCLEKSNWFNLNGIPKIRKATIDTFLKDDVPSIKDKWNEIRKQERSNYPDVTACEWDFNRVINKAETIKNIK